MPIRRGVNAEVGGSKEVKTLDALEKMSHLWPLGRGLVQVPDGHSKGRIPTPPISPLKRLPIKNAWLDVVSSQTEVLEVVVWRSASTSPVWAS